MAEVLMLFPEQLEATGGILYTAQACGRPAVDGGWEGWIEFLPDDGSPALRSQRETRQPDRDALVYWATGLTRVYLEGSLERTLDPVRPRPKVHAEPAYGGPAPDPFAPAPAVPAVLDPFSVYAKGEELLRQELNALCRWHLRNISRAYGLLDADAPEMLRLTRVELAEQIVQAVRTRVEEAVSLP
ncbi:MAG TPA: hypothetical protein VGX68_28140 [Thermoanaerobaculia bacterium]|nr:hypothetical protein [Thermoanaerobaculia bacterium]